MHTKPLTSLILVIMTSSLLVSNTFADHLSEESIENRIAAKDELAVYKKGEEPADTTTTSKQEESASESKSPEQLYKANCMVCHATGAAGAPIVGNAKAWAQRIEQKGLEKLISNSINGINAMPPRGGSGYNDEELAAIVNYMIEQSQ